MKNLNLSVPKPCHETWESFTTTRNGAFCDSCKKVVIDFTKMNGDEIIRSLSKKETQVCGRFRSDQLKIYQASRNFTFNPDFKIFKVGFLSLLLLVAIKPLAAQSQLEKAKTEQLRTENQMQREHILKGILVSEDGSALVGGYVVLKGTTIGTMTDEEGRFEFPQKVKEGDVIIFSFIGYNTQEYIVADRSADTEIKMKMELLMTLGEVAINEVYIEKPSAIHRFWERVKNVF